MIFPRSIRYILLIISQTLKICILGFSGFFNSYFLLCYWTVRILRDSFLLMVSLLVFYPLLDSLWFVHVILAGIEHIFSETVILFHFYKKIEECNNF